jgi:hypothetical protein
MATEAVRRTAVSGPTELSSRPERSVVEGPAVSIPVLTQTPLHGQSFSPTSAVIRLERGPTAGFPDRENCLDRRQPSESVAPIRERCVRAVTERWQSILRKTTGA